MPGDAPQPDGPVSPAAQRWNERFVAAAIDRVPTPQLTEVARARSTAWAQEVLPPLGGTVLDIGCGRGGGSLALVPPATEIIGVDPRGVLLDEFVAAAAERGVARRTVHGAWPDVVATTPVADVAICQQVMQAIDDIVPFVLTLTDRARLAVVAELPAEHPSPPMRALAASLGVHIEPAVVRAGDLVPVLAELGLAPETASDERKIAAHDEPSAAHRAIAAWLGLGSERGEEVAELVTRHLTGQTIDVITLRWPGAADPTR